MNQKWRQDRRFKDKEVSEERTDFSFKWLSCPFISNQNSFLYHMLIRMKKLICFLYFLSNPVINVVKCACLVQMDPSRPTFKDYGVFLFPHHNPKVRNQYFCSKFCGKFFMLLDIHINTRTAILFRNLQEKPNL